MSAGALLSRFERHLISSRILAGEHHILVALSGGVDSVVLLDLLRRRNTPVTAAHFDHAMREDSAADTEWVQRMCADWDVACITERADNPPRNEDEARTLRYDFLARALARARASVIVTAHHADDQAETVLFRLIRGTGIAGLAGIPARRDNIARPLLPFTRSDILGHARDEKLRWRDDPTNAELRFARNRIRHVILPALEQLQSGAAGRIAQLATRVSEAESAWRDAVKAAVADVVTGRDQWGYALARERILAYHPHVRARVLRHLIGRLGSRPGRSVTRVAMAFVETGASGRSIELPGGVRLGREFDALWLRKAATGPTDPDAALVIESAEPGSGIFVAGGRSRRSLWETRTAAAEDSGSAAHASFDLSSLRFPLELRSWRAGDRIRLAGGTRKLKKLFQEKRVARSERATVAVLVDSAGVVLWVAGLARSTHSAPVAGAPVFEVRVGDVAAS